MAETPFIDMAVHDAVREPLLRGNAAIAFENEFSDLTWANGPAALLFGHKSISGLLETGMHEFIPALRQLKAALDRSEDGNAKSMVRITSGMRSRLMPIDVKRIGEDQVLVIFHDEDDLSESEALSRMISGLEEDGAVAAVIDAAGATLATEGSFGATGLSKRQLSSLAADVSLEDDRLVKRIVTASESGERVAVGVGRLRDEPLVCLILAVPTGDVDAEALVPAPHDGADEDGDFDTVESVVAEDEAGDAAVEAGNKADDTGPDATEDDIHEPFVFEPQRGPVRFVWKMDSDGIFTEVSEEFTHAIGPLAADIVGKGFDEVCERFDLDRSGDISASLKRRDTWSGKSVAWPVQDTDKRIPVDLAALPFYNRDRVFEGYRGFGIARLNESHTDPDATGLTLGGAAGKPVEDVAGDEAVTEPAPDGSRARSDAAIESLSTPSEADDLGDPFKGEVPALHSAKITPFRRGSDNSPNVETAPKESNAKALDDSEADAFRQIGEALGGTAKHEDNDKLVEGDDPLEVYYNHLEGSEELPPAPKPGDNDTELEKFHAETGDADAELSDGDETTDLDDIGNVVTGHDDTFESTEDQANAGDHEADVTPEHRDGSRGVGRLIGRSLLGDEIDDSETHVETNGGGKTSLPGYSLDDSNDDEPAELLSTRRRAIIDENTSIDMSDIIADEPDDDLDDDTSDIESGLPADTRQMETKLERGFDWRDHQESSDNDDYPDELTDLPDARSGSRDGTGKEDLSDRRDRDARQGLTPDALDGLPLPLLVVRGETALFANASFQIMTGYDTIDDLNRRGGVDALFAGIDESDFHAEAGHTVKRAMTLVAADGDHFPARAHLQIVPWEGSSALMFAIEPVNRLPEETAPYVDAPALRLDEEKAPSKRSGFPPEIEDNEEFKGHVEELTAILDIATDGVVILSHNGTIQSINGPAAALFGYRQEELQDKSFSMLFAHESQRAAIDYMSSIAGSGVASLLNEGREVLGREKNGGFLPLFMSMGRLPQDGRMCAVLRDITHWKQTEQALQDAKREAENSSNSKSEFLAKISHEIRTPLNAIIGFSELMMEQRFGPIGNERYVGYLTDINKSGRHVLDLINDLLDISKIEAGKQELSFEGVHLNEAVADALSMVQPLATRERIIMRSSFDANLPDVVADLRSVKQIVLNLLSNAVRFTPAGGLVVASTSFTNDGGVVLRIKDTGIGMTPKEVDTAMQPFKQVADLGRKRGDGTGLGLPLTKALVEANRAEFTIHSEPGRGTIVEIHFPQARVLAD